MVAQAMLQTAQVAKTFTKASASSKRVAAKRPVVRVEASKKQEQLVAGVTVGVATMMAHPLVAEAAVTASLKNLINSVIAGGLVLGLIAAAITGVSNFDPVNRK